MSLSTAKLKRVISIRGKIERLEAQLEKLVGGIGAKGLTAAGTPRKRRKMSAAARKAISAAAKARWAKYRAEKK